MELVHNRGALIFIKTLGKLLYVFSLDVHPQKKRVRSISLGAEQKAPYAQSVSERQQ
jgi:hypothetical protein